jgi:small subunit ribosomal protein S9
MAKAVEQFWATGRRKCASAAVHIKAGKGTVSVNKRAFEDYFVDDAVRNYILQPLVITGTAESYDVAANIKGGGCIGQAGAMRHGIARALTEANPELRGVLQEGGMLTRDSRVKERKKYGQPGARKRFQFSKR